MSGFEVVGVVLGLFPIVCDAAKDFKDVAKDVKSWWKFQRSFEEFVRNLTTQQVYFDEIVKAVLNPLQELSNQELGALQYSTDLSPWYDLRVQEILTHRIDRSHVGWFMRHMKEIFHALTEIRDILPLGRVYQLDGTDLESTIFRILNSFSHKKDKLLTTITNRISDLYNYLTMPLQLHLSRTLPHKTTRDSLGLAKSFRNRQEQAESVFSGFKSCWICNCELDSCHPCGISTEGPDMKLLLNGARNKHLKIEVEVRREAQPFNELCSEPPTVASPADLEDLMQKSLWKRLSKNMRKKGKGVANLAQSAVSALSNPGNAKADDKYDKGLERAPGKLKKRHQEESNTKVAQTPKVRFNLPPELVATPTPPSAINRNDQAIGNMCLTIKTPSQKTCLGFLELSDVKLFLHLDHLNYPEPLQLQSFEQFLTERHPRDSRLKLGLTVIILILKLGPPWIPDTPLKSSLVLLQTPGSSPKPFISHPSIHVALKATSTTEFEKEKAKATFLALGIMLLELLFRGNLEQQSFWATFTDNGQRHELTEFTAAIRWQKDAVYEYGEKVANAISKCVSYGIDNSVNLRSVEFLQEVREKVLKPIEETLADSSNT